MMLHLYSRLPLLCVLAITTSFAIAPAAQERHSEPLPTFHGTLDLVTIQASVRDRRGRPIANLKASDFDILDNGTQTPVVSLGFDRESPISVAVLVDMSGSMRLSEKVDMARHAFDSVLSQLRNGIDEVAVYSFDSTLHERRAFTSDIEVAGDALDDFEPFGTTSLYDAAAATAQRLSARSAARKAIMILTDGLDTTSTLSAHEVTAMASAIDVPVYIVATVPALDHRLMLEASARATGSRAADLRDLAELTGGQFTFSSTTVETFAAVTQVIGELRQQYVLAIEAGRPAQEWRRLNVRVKRPAAQVKARSGYFGG